MIPSSYLLTEAAQNIVLLPPPAKGKTKRPADPAPVPTLSLFPNCKATTEPEGITLAEWVCGVRDGRWRAKAEKCRATRQQDGAEAYGDLRKAIVPAVTLSVSLSTRAQGATPDERGEVHSGLLQIDLDLKDHPGKSLAEIRATVEAAPFIAACFASLSGQGMKGVARVPASIAQHRASWLAAAAYFKERGLTLDPSTKDLRHLCFVSFDPDAFLHLDAEELVPLEVPEIEPEQTGEGHKGSVRVEFARQVAAELAGKLGRPPRADWLKISSAFFDGVGVAAGIELLEEAFPPEEPDEYERLAKSLRYFVAWDTLRAFGVDTDDWVSLLPGLPADDDEAHVEANESDCQPFPITRVCDMEGAAEALDFVEGLLTEGGASVVYGPSNCGKSFWALDLACSVATGKPFRGLECEQGAVIYVALEGCHGARNRIEALKRAGRLPADAPLFLCFVPVSLLKRKHAGQLAATVKHAAAQSGLPCRLVILDTLARAMAGGDENSGKDMGTAVKSMDAIRDATGAHVLLIHHCGKNEALGARGHSSLRAAVDTEIEISRPEGESISTVRATKQRDLSPGEAMPFSLKVVALGIDRRGKPITSCVVHHEDTAMARKPGKAGRKALCTAEDMLQYLPASSVTEWQERVQEETGLKSSGFYLLKRKLETSQRFRVETSPKQIVRNDPADALPDLTE